MTDAQQLKTINNWSEVFKSLYERRNAILRFETTIKGQKKIFEKEKETFFLGNIRCDLAEKGWKFYLK